MKLKKILQIGLLVEDAETMAKFYQERLGIGGWSIGCLCSKDSDVTINGVHYDEPVAKIAVTKVFGMELELIEPLGKTRYQEWVNEHGSGMHHLAFEFEDDYESILQFGKGMNNGSETWIRGKGYGGFMDYSYVDLSKQAGFYLECYKNIAPGRTGIPFDFKGENASNIIPGIPPVDSTIGWEPKNIPQLHIKKLLQIGLLVKDTDAMVKFYEENFGITGWNVNISDGSAGMTINGQGYEGPVTKVAITNVFGLELEFIEPIAPSPYKDWVDKHGSGMHHMAFEFEESYYDVRKFSEDYAHGNFIRGQGMGGKMDFSYLDFSKEAGFYLETYKFIAPGRTGIPIDYKGENASNIDLSFIPASPAEI